MLNPILEEKTGIQSVDSYGEILTNPLPAAYSTYRTMRKEPTIAMARELAIAPILASNWTLEIAEGVPESRRQEIKDDIFPIRSQFLTQALLGGIDYGWAPFEKIWALDGSGKLRLKRLKHLLPDLTLIRVETETGAFLGFRQKTIDLELSKCFLVSFRVEGTNWHGQSQLENVRGVYNQWVEANAGAERYDQKQAGSHWVIYFPPGVTKVDGVDKDNRTLAREILASLRSSGSVAIPSTLQGEVDAIGDPVPTWKIELMSDSGGRQPTFIPRLRYLDTLKVRGLITPERALLEGQYGTKAEAGTHIDLALTYRDLQHQYVVDYLNWHVIDQLLAFNYGESARGSVFVKTEPLSDDKRAWFREIYKAFLANPVALTMEYSSLNKKAFQEMLGIPFNNTEEEMDVVLDPEPENLA